jgi:ATP-dependent DNA helicase DinG
MQVVDIDKEIEESSISIEDVFGPNGFIAAFKPGYEVREPQIRVAEIAERAIRDEKQAIIEAGTGTGKSFALVVPAVLSGKRTVITTETNTLLDQYVNQDLPFLQKILPKAFSFAKAKGKGNYVCKQKIDACNSGQMWGSLYANPDEVGMLIEWAKKTASGDRSEPTFAFSDASWQMVGCDELCAHRQCPYYGDGVKGETDCFAYQARKEFLQADIVVTNHTLCLLNAQIGGDAIIGDHSILIVDEAHTLAEQAQKTFGCEIKQTTLSGFSKCTAKACKQGNMELHGYDPTLIEDAERYFFEQFRRLAKEQMTFAEIPGLIIQEAQKAAEPVLRCLDMLRTAINSICPPTDEDQKMLQSLDDRAQEHMKHIKGLFEPAENWLPFVEIQQREDGDRHATISYKPVDVAPILRRDLYGARQSVILASATMAIGRRFDFPIRDLGLFDPLTLQVESPFDYVAQCSCLLPTALPYPQAPDYHTALADTIEQILIHTQGRAFVLFTSYRDLNKVYDLISCRLKYTLLKQGDLPKPALIEAFRRDVHSVLFATRTFYTGVDIPGESLSCVILVKMPFRPPTEPLFKAKCQLIKAQGRNDFREYSLPLAVNDLRQAFGRLIRSKADVGLFAFLDSRAINKPYFRTVANSLPNMKVRTRI